MHRARRRQAGRLRVLPAASLRIRGGRRLARARHARDQQQDRALQGRVRSGATAPCRCTSRAKVIRGRASRCTAIRTTAFPVSAIGGHGIGGCLVGNARAALEMSIELVKARSTNYTGAEDARFPDRAAAHRRGRREDRRRSAAPAQRRAWRRSASTRTAARSPSRRGCATSATARWRRSCASKRSTRCTRWPARTASTTIIRCSACSATRTPLLGTSASASMRNSRRGGWSRWAGSSRARRFDE